MNWLDFVLLILVAGSVVTAFLKGLSRELVGLVAVVAALLLGCWLYGTAGSYLLSYVNSKAIANFIGFFAVFCFVILAGALIGRLMRGLMKAAGLSIFDRLLGAGFGLLRGMLLAIAIVMAMMAFSPGKRPPRAIIDSRFAPYVIDAAHVCASMAPYELREGFRTSYREIKSVWDGAVKKGIRALPSKQKKDSDEREI